MEKLFKRGKKRLWGGLLTVVTLLAVGFLFWQSELGTYPVSGENEIDFSQIEESTEQESAPETVVESTEEVPEEPPRLTLIMVGDVLMHMRVTKTGKQEDGSYSYTHLFAPVAEAIQEADLALVNQEVILGGEELGLSGYPRFNAPYAVGDTLVETGFDVILHATNHTVDKGKEGVLNCLSFWRENYPDITIVGIADSQEDRDRIRIVEQEGMKIAILNYTYSTNGLPVPKDMPYLVNMLEEEQIKADVEKAKEEADFVVLCPHWGTEYTHKASKAQKRWAALFLEWGVDLVIGTHPHVIQPVEWLENEAGEKMLVYWSLGNFVNSTASEGEGVADRMLGAMAQVTLTRADNGEVVIEEYDAKPMITYVSRDSKTIATYFMEDFTEEMAENSSTKRKDSNFSVEYCKQVWEKVFGTLGLSQN